MNKLDLRLLLNNTGIISEKHREYTEEVAREINSQIEMNVIPNFNDILELTYLATRAAKFGTKDDDYRKVLEDVYELLQENEIELVKIKLESILRK